MVDTLGNMRRWFWVIDSLVVISFVLIGRDSHGFISDPGDIARVSAPFLIALAISIVLLRAWRNPASLLMGLWLGLSTLVIGMVLRHLLFDAGTARVFVMVTGAWFVGLMVGWRLVPMLVTKLRAN
jgi:hypothetical protein